MHFHPGLYQVSLPIELVDFNLKVERTKIQPMVVSISSRIADSPVVQVKVERRSSLSRATVILIMVQLQGRPRPEGSFRMASTQKGPALTKRVRGSVLR